MNLAEEFNAKVPNTLLQSLGIQFEEVTKDRVTATMPVDGRTHQPFGLLHGGASVALAETVASVAAQLNAPEGRMAVGLEINANHLRARRIGLVSGTATPLHRGRTTSVWEIRISDEAGSLVCISRCTLTYVRIPGLQSDRG